MSEQWYCPQCGPVAHIRIGLTSDVKDKGNYILDSLAIIAYNSPMQSLVWRGKTA